MPPTRPGPRRRRCRSAPGCARPAATSGAASRSRVIDRSEQRRHLAEQAAREAAETAAARAAPGHRRARSGSRDLGTLDRPTRSGCSWRCSATRSTAPCRAAARSRSPPRTGRWRSGSSVLESAGRAEIEHPGRGASAGPTTWSTSSTWRRRRGGRSVSRAASTHRARRNARRRGPTRARWRPRACCAGPCSAPPGRTPTSSRSSAATPATCATGSTANTGWRLIVDTEVARLVKTVGRTRPTPPTPRATRGPSVPFSRRRYVLICLALAVLERADAQITLGRLAEQIVLAAADPELAAAGRRVHPGAARGAPRSGRGGPAAARPRACCARVAGDEEAFVRRDGDVALRRRPPGARHAARHAARTLHRHGRRPSTSGSPSSPRSCPPPPTTCATGAAPPAHPAAARRARALLRRAGRGRARLPDLPAPAITGRITELTGLVAEVRAEGIAMVDPDDELTDVRMPEAGTDGHVTLLLAEHLAGRGAHGAVDRAARARARAGARVHAAYWRTDATAARRRGRTRRARRCAGSRRCAWSSAAPTRCADCRRSPATGSRRRRSAGGAR